MSEPFVGEIRMFAGNFAPRGWAFCDGQLLAVSQSDALFSLVGTYYGGDGETTFGLPDLRGRMPVHRDTNGTRIGSKSGTEQVTLTPAEMPRHSHTPQASNVPATTDPENAVWAAWTDTPYAPAGSTTVQMNADALTTGGGNRPHNNMPPFLAVNFIIALFGVYPSQH
jgi:microcystin-dependent protein